MKPSGPGLLFVGRFLFCFFNKFIYLFVFCLSLCWVFIAVHGLLIVVASLVAKHGL